MRLGVRAVGDSVEIEHGSLTASTNRALTFGFSVHAIEQGEAHAGGFHHFDQGRRGQDHDGRQSGRLHAADAGLRVLLLDLDVQPTLSSYFTLAFAHPAAIYEMLTVNEHRAEQLVSHTAIAACIWCSPMTTAAS